MFKNSLTPALLALVVLLSACSSTAEKESASAASATDETVASADTSAADANQVRCKRYSQTGTRISTKVCKTNAEWDAQAKSARDAAEAVQRGSVHNAGMEAN